jgi:hypothetical protein
VSFVNVEGRYDKGHTRSNPQEAKAIVDEVVRRLAECQKGPEPHLVSIGVVSFSKVQQNLIEDLLTDELDKHPELKDCQEDAQKGELEFVKGKFMKKIAEGSLGAMCFYLERKGGWTNKQTVAADVPLPNIVLGVIPESELPTEGEPIKLTQIVQKEDIAAETADREAEKERAEQEAIVRQEDAAEASKPLPTPEVSEDDGDDDWDDEGTPQIF